MACGISPTSSRRCVDALISVGGRGAPLNVASAGVSFPGADLLVASARSRDQKELISTTSSGTGAVLDFVAVVDVALAVCTRVEVDYCPICGSNAKGDQGQCCSWLHCFGVGSCALVDGERV